MASLVQLFQSPNRPNVHLTPVLTWHLMPEDILVFATPQMLSEEQMAYVRTQVRQLCQRDSLVLQPEMTVHGVIRPTEIHQECHCVICNLDRERRIAEARLGRTIIRS